MELSVGQKVAYPNQGVCLVEDIERKEIGDEVDEVLRAAGFERQLDDFRSDGKRRNRRHSSDYHDQAISAVWLIN